MPIDPNIPLQAKGVQLATPESQLNMMASAAKLNEYNRSVDEQNALRDLIKSGVDIKSPEARQKMYEISPEMGMKFEKSQADLNKSAMEGKKLGLEVNEKTLALARQRTADLAFNPSDNNVKAHLEDGVLRGEVTPQQAQQQWATVSQMNGAQRKEYFTQLGMKVDERAKLMEQMRHNKTTEGISAGQLDVARYNATKPVFNEAVGGFVTRPTAANPSSTVIPLANPEATTKGQVVAKGKNLVNDVATDMAASYGVLKDLGGIKSKENSPQQNISAALQSSMVGQIGGSMMGTPEQDARDAIMSQRPILVQAIVKATGMSSQQINSNQELKNMLDAATDPSKGYETNIKTLNKINKRFGLGGDVVELPTAPTKEKVSVGAAPKANPTIDALLEKYK